MSPTYKAGFASDRTPLLYRAIALFVGALVLGASALATDTGGPWLVSAAVIGYGAWLAVVQFEGQWLNGALKDSPYFLGFILTLIALLVLFWNFGTSSADLDEQSRKLITRVADALATTVAGLVMRQLLHTLDRGDPARENAVASLYENAARFAADQEKLATMIREFSESRVTVFDAERKAHERYVASLTNVTQRLGELEQLWPDRLAALQNALRSATTEFADSATKSASLVDEARKGLRDAVATAADTIGQAGTRGANTMFATAADLRAAFQAIVDDLGEVQKHVREQVASLRNELADYPAEAQRLTQVVKTAGDDVAGLSSHVTTLSREVGTASTSITGFAATLQTTHKQASVAAESGQQLSDAATQRVRQLVGDLEAIDDVVDQVAALLQRRVEAAGAPFGAMSGAMPGAAGAR